MTDRRTPDDPNEPPEDVVNLFSWANLRGAKYRDFSASRAENRERARLQAQQEQEQALQEAEAQQAEAARLAAEAQEMARQAELAAQQAARRAAELTARARSVSAPEIEEGAMRPEGPSAELARGTPPIAEQRPAPERAAASDPAAFGGEGIQAGFRSAPGVSAPGSVAGRETREPVPTVPENVRREENPPAGNKPPPRTPWSGPGGRDLPARPAWLSERPAGTGPATMSQTPPDTIQGSRERLTSRWFALKSVLGSGANVASEPAPAPLARPPVLAVFSLAGGVGKTSVVATLGRALSSRGERVLLVDTAAFGLLPFFFGARDQRPGQLRTFNPPANSGDAPIQMITLDLESPAGEGEGQDSLSTAIQQYGRGTARAIIDLATAAGATTRRILWLTPLILVPVLPDMNSVVSVGSIEGFFERNSGAAGKPLFPYYVLNQFDASLPLHLDVREVLREQLGDRLLPFALRRAPAVSEALAEGMTVMDYAPNSTVAEDFGALAGWVKSQSAPAMTGFRGVRWSER